MLSTSESPPTAAIKKQIIANPARRAELAEQGRRYVETERTWDRLTDRYAEIYRRIGVRA